tara:strand:+ start:503 stop:763 length:261 start_codon:yes stop_codon:yes gene_type:complete
LKNLKTKALTVNSRGFIAMAINPNTKTTKIYLHGFSKDGIAQWYESKATFKTSTALNYFYNGEYKVVFYSREDRGITKSNVTDWWN